MRSNAEIVSDLISVCICTFRRTEGLMSALQSVALQQLSPYIRFEVIVVDNDSQPSARKVCDAFLINYPAINLKYFNEIQSGVSFARNRCLSESAGKWIAFLDDDERASDNWLLSLHSAASKYNADAVFGPVLPIYESAPPVWLIAGRIHERARFSTGTPIGWEDARTGNVLMHRSLVEAVGGFDSRLARTGGEDTYFFLSAINLGFRLVWCDEAEIIETVPYNRMTKAWAIRRSFHGGRTFVRIRATLKGQYVYPTWLLHGLGVILLLALPTLILWLLQRKEWFYFFRKMAGGAGKIVAPFYSAGGYGQTVDNVRNTSVTKKEVK